MSPDACCPRCSPAYLGRDVYRYAVTERVERDTEPLCLFKESPCRLPVSSGSGLESNVDVNLPESGTDGRVNGETAPHIDIANNLDFQVLNGYPSWSAIMRVVLSRHDARAAHNR